MLPADVDGLKGCNGPTFPVSDSELFYGPSASFPGRRNQGKIERREKSYETCSGSSSGRTTHTVWRRMRPPRALLDMKGKGSRRQKPKVTRFPTALSGRIGASFSIRDMMGNPTDFLLPPQPPFSPSTISPWLCLTFCCGLNRGEK